MLLAKGKRRCKPGTDSLKSQVETMNEASVGSTREETLSCTQTYGLWRLDSVDHDNGADGRNVRQCKTYQAYVIHAFEPSCFF